MELGRIAECRKGNESDSCTLTQNSHNPGIKPPSGSRMKSRSIFGTRFFSTSEIQLGNLIPDIAQPDLNYHQSPISLHDGDYTVKEIEDLRGSSESKRSSNLRLFLSRLFAASSTHSHSASEHLVARQGRMYTLNQPKAVFRKLCADPSVRAWLEEQIDDGNDVHFVIGLDTLVEAKKSGGCEREAQDTVKLTVPVAELAGLPTGGTLDVSIKADHAQSRGVHWAYRSPGENVYAIRLQRVKFNFWKHVDSVKLGREDYWLTISDNRGSEQEAEYIEASLGSDEEMLDEVREVEDGNGPIYICDIED